MTPSAPDTPDTPDAPDTPGAPDAPDMPLRYQTPPAWAASVLDDPLRLLNDHAHLEKKAATNALEMLNRCPAPDSFVIDSNSDKAATGDDLAQTRSNLADHWAVTMTAIARDEIEHLAAVLKLIHRRGGQFTRSHRNPYAKALRELVRQGTGPLDLMDRLMVSALIEARSCERFQLLAEHCTDPPLARLYQGLHASEHGHYLVFLDLARTVHHRDEVEARWQWMLDQEAQIIATQPTGPAMHSGCA